MRRRTSVYRPSSTSRSSAPSSPAASACSSRSALSAATRAAITWPLSNPTSIRTRSGTDDELREDAVHRLRVDERDLRAEQAAPRRGVDQLRSFAPQARELRREVVDLVGDVVHPGAPPGEEAPDRRVGPQGREQLDVPGADEQRRRLDPLLVLRLPTRELRTEQPLVARDRLVEVGDRDADVVYALHEARLYLVGQQAGTARPAPKGAHSRAEREPCRSSRRRGTPARRARGARRARPFPGSLSRAARSRAGRGPCGASPGAWSPPGRPGR